eukprot:CAMPEP_0201524408 /NCGR_PEP_ID=MMETSP0161_2-20130828/21711_1 /ASSEMBLY_ACC=CAM_ASM_000251 /TAXON_ID=180227 /ORGANISM="Neoparamoeba aestuarina, Strain SoJaBio B1-5/56/2" /LENGTH=468 /DNA_ID=CAMNT_0047923779 /DNA_START=92 /DNA_END=1498 /DNA_ORIENTATION=+
MSLEEAKKAYEMYGRVKKAEETLQHLQNAPGEVVDDAQDALKKKANDLFGLRKGDLKGRLSVMIRKGFNIGGDEGFFGGKSDPYVIITLDGKELGRTTARDNAENPTWNEAFTFEVDGTYEDFALHVLDEDVDEDDHLGVAVISAKSIYKKRVVDGNFPLKKATVEEIASANGDDVELKPVPVGEKPPESTGTINFRVEYHPPRFEGKLEVEVFNADGLYNADGGFMQGVSDPYVALMIDSDKVRETSTVKNDLSPEWNETLNVCVTGEHTTIFLVVHDDDHASCDDCLGHVKINASELMEKNEITETLQLMPKPGCDEEKARGKISFRMKHTPPVLNGTITATVMKANGLADSDHGLLTGKSDPYTVLAFDGVQQAKTHMIDSSKDPEWNETFPPIPVSGSVQSVSFTVMDYDEDTEHDHLGTISFGAEQIIMDRTIQGNFPLGPSPGTKTVVQGTISISLQYEPNE